MMMKKWSVVAMLVWLVGMSSLGVPFSQAQEDGLNLPTEFYVLLNAGQVQRFGIGATGVTTITPETLFVLDFGIAPDGDWLAFRTEDGLFFTRLSTPQQPPLEIEGVSADVPPVRGQGDTMAWTPDGAALAYTTLNGLRVYFAVGRTFFDVPIMPLRHLTWSPNGSYLAAEAEGDIWWIYRRDGAQLTLASALPASAGIAWLDDTRLIFAPPSGGLVVMNLADANTQIALTPADTRYRLPVLRQDDTLLAFASDEIDGQTFEFLQAFALNRDELSAAPDARSAAPVDLAGARWAPGGQLMVTFREGALSLLLPLTGDSFGLPIVEAVAYGWGAARPPAVTGFNLSADGYFRAPGASGTLQVWRLRADGLPPVALTPEDQEVTAYTIGRSVLAYAAGDQVFAAVFSGSTLAAPLALIGFDGQAVRDLALSPDEDQLALTTDSGIYLLSTQEAAAELPAPILANSAETRYSRPNFALNIDALLVTVDIDAERELQLYDLTSGELLTLGRYVAGDWLPDGRLMGYGPGLTELYLVDPLNPQATTAPILRAPAVILQAQGATPQTARALVLVGGENGPAPLRLAEVSLVSGELSGVRPVGFIARPQLSPDGAFIAGFAQGTGEAGTLLLFSLDANQTLALALPPLVTDFQWGR